MNRNNDVALTKSSPLTSLVSRISQNPTQWDNILDGSNCYSVRLPVVITLNGEIMSVETADDLDAVEYNMNYSGSDDDIVHFQFPITIVKRNFSEEVIASQTQLDAVTCNNQQFGEINCIDFIFPVVINRYDTNSQVAQTVTLYDNADLYSFIENLSTNDVFTIAYPVTVTFGGSNQMEVGNNNELEAAIEQAIETCENPNPVTLESIIQSGNWYISYCEDHDSNSGNNWIDIYYGYVFTFNANGSVTATKYGVANNGTWDTYQDSHQMLELFFPMSGLHGLTNDEWRVVEYNANNFRLRNDQSGGDDGHEYVYFTKL